MPKSKKYKQFTEENGEISYFSVQKTSGDDGACGFAAIYAIAGSNESGETARAKGVNQLQEYIKDPKVRNLIKSELKGFLTSDDGNTQDLIKYEVITKEELNDIKNFQKSSQTFIDKVNELKRIHLGDDELSPELAEEYRKNNNSYYPILLELGSIPLEQKNELKNLFKIKQADEKKIEDFVDSKIEDYVNNAVAKSHFWLSVAGKSPGVLGALAQINNINFRVFSTANNSDQMKKECEHISVEGRPMHNLHLQTNVAGTAGFHFEVLKEVRPEQVNVAGNSSGHILREDIVMPKENLGNSKQDEDLLAYGQAMVDLMTNLRLEDSSSRRLGIKRANYKTYFTQLFDSNGYKKYIDVKDRLKNDSELEQLIKAMHNIIEQGQNIYVVQHTRDDDHAKLKLPRDNIKESFEPFETTFFDLKKKMEINFSSSSSKQDDLTTEPDDDAPLSPLLSLTRKQRQDIESQLTADRLMIDRVLRKAFNGSAELVDSVNEALIGLHRNHPNIPLERMTQQVLPYIIRVLDSGPPGENNVELRIKGVQAATSILVTAAALFIVMTALESCIVEATLESLVNNTVNRLYLSASAIALASQEYDRYKVLSFTAQSIQKTLEVLVGPASAYKAVRFTNNLIDRTLNVRPREENNGDNPPNKKRKI